jgi:peptide/nickel transport system permease protein
MLKMLGVRLAQMLALFLVFLAILFFLIQLSPGDPTLRFIGNPDIPPQARLDLIKRFGLDQPLHVQFLTYMRNFFTGDLGVSLMNYPRPVAEILWERVPRTIWLFFGSTLLAYYFGFVWGKVLAWKRGGFSEYGVTLIGVFLFTVFVPWFALMMIWLFAFMLSLFPTGKFLDPTIWRGTPFGANDVFIAMLATVGTMMVVGWIGHVLARRAADSRGLSRTVSWATTAAVFGGAALYWGIFRAEQVRYALDILHHTILPTLTVTLIAFGGVMLLMRTSMLETLSEDYILTARAKGLPDKVIRDRHAARNALLPVVTSLVLALASIIGGGIVTESLFAWPGVGVSLLNAAIMGDYPLALGALAFIGILALVGHLVVDILYSYLDPRIRVH